MARRNRSLFQPEAARVHADFDRYGAKLERAGVLENPQDEILGLSGYRSRVLYPKFQDGGGVNSGSMSAADGRLSVGGSLFSRDINFLSNKGRGGKKKKRNPRQDEILGLSGYKARVLYPKFEDGGGVNSGSLSARDGRARVGGSLFTNEINFLSNKKRGKVKKNAYEYTGQGALNNPRQDEILGISGYHARVLWPKFSLTGGVNSGNADYIPTSTTGSLFNREINFLSNGRGGRRKGRSNPSKEQQVKALAQEITRTWTKVSPYAEQQLFMMLHPEYIMGGDRVEHVVASFLANAQGWRGDDAKRIKAQLKKLL